MTNKLDLSAAFLASVDTQFKRSMLIDYWLDGTLDSATVQQVIEATGFDVR